jgi:hypothetical protein
MDGNRKLKNPDFKLGPWLAGPQPQPLYSNDELPPAIPAHASHSEKFHSTRFSPNSFLIPGWQGEGLLSKKAVGLRKLLHELESDAREQFQQALSFPQKRKQDIYQEFCEFIQDRNIECKELLSFITFWQHFAEQTSPYRKEIEDFSQTFCYRSVLIYLNKVRFIVHVTKSTSTPLQVRDLGNINNLISRLFVQGSSTQLQCDSLRPNQYSWYLPKEHHRAQLFNRLEDLVSISITELGKIFSTDSKTTGSQSEGHDLDLIDSDYSHALSHRSFGLFINELIVTLPEWLGVQPARPKPFACYEQEPKALSTKYCGDFLKALSLSHWLAQEFNLSLKWRQLICPDFVGDDFRHGFFLKTLHELHFLSFLVQFANAQGHDPIQLTCRIVREKYAHAMQSFDQMPLWNNQQAESLQYKRAIINVCHLPKKNPHHFLVSKIALEAKSLSRDGYLYIFTNQKLFVPSHAERVASLLKTLKLEAHFCFEHLKGKGEVPNYLYVFTRRNLETIENAFIPSFKMPSKESCLSFRWSGDLTRFNKFEQLVYELSEFMKNKKPDATPIYRHETPDGISLDFHQDAVFEGKLSSSHSTKDAPQITHPIFFKKFTRSSVHLEQFFQIEVLSAPHREAQADHLPSALLGIPFAKLDRYPLVLIVDMSEIRPRIELINYELYHAKYEQYGSAYFRYFGLLPKRNDININTFKEYFNSRLGLQIIEFCLNGGQANLKSKLRSLLVPKFFEDCISVPEHNGEKFKFLLTSTQDLLSTHPSRLKADFQRTLAELQELSFQYPWFLLGMLSSFKTQLANAILETKKESTNQIDYSNPLIINSLLNLPSKSLFKDNEDVYLDFQITEIKDFHLSLTDQMIRKDADNVYLELSHDGRPIVRLYATQSLLEFIRFVFASAIGSPISLLIQNCTIPKASELDQVIQNFQLMSGQLQDIFDQTERTISDLFHRQITTP